MSGVVKVIRLRRHIRESFQEVEVVKRAVIGDKLIVSYYPEEQRYLNPIQ